MIIIDKTINVRYYQKMKTMNTIICITLGLLTACATTGRSEDSSIVPLGQAITEAAEHLENTLEKGAVLAFLNFSSPSETFSTYVLDELSDRLVNNGKLVVVDRTQLDMIRQEERFQLSGEVSDATAVSIGQKLGASVVVSGSLVGMGQIYRIRIRALAVETAVIAASRSIDINPREERVRVLLAGTVPVVETAPQSVRNPAQTPSVPQSVGPPADTHTFFHDKNSNGEIIITGYSGSGGAVIIPAEINGAPVRRIFDNAFREKSLTSITIPDSVITIDTKAFAFNDKLNGITIGSSVISIGAGAFWSHKTYTIVIPNSVRSIGKDAFSSPGVYPNRITIGDNVILGDRALPVEFTRAYNGMGGTYLRQRDGNYSRL